MGNQPTYIPQGVKDNSQVEQQLQYLSEAIQIADGLIDQLSLRIQSVLSPEMKIVNEQGKPTGNAQLVPLSFKINQSTANVNDLKDKLQSIIGRIQL